MVLAVALRRVGTVVALLGIGCLLVALVLSWVHFESNPAFPDTASFVSRDYSALRLLGTSPRVGSNPAFATLLFYLLPVVGSCLVAVAGLRAWQGSASHRSGSARLLLGMGCALFGLVAIPVVVNTGFGIFQDGPPVHASVGPGARLALLGYGAVVAGGVLLAVGALLHQWTLRRNASHASAMTTE